ncbi:neurogenic locus notch homolog protein 2-like isoform X2 [Microplitis mediator]|nr:neurogenic locus notch homolog protein 2-like isoform X2 [Microplitis mediator]XP_057333066.1 neurogenic locus notch homolog protein 2-like isoform X2 [Microplitis mediator]XP_057333067.1 neurogenic locus notch homolog protein 2-like isoform X2 [Microplitis mediator]
MICNNDNDCDAIKHAKCSKGKKCVCRANNIQLNETTCSPLLGGFCWKNETCVPDNSHCINNECRCNDNYLQVSNTLCMQKEQGIPCSRDSDCQGIYNTKCFNRTVCAPLLGGFCSTANECIPDNSVCIDNKCTCKSEYYPRFNTQCVQIQLSGFCDTNRRCDSIKHSTCNKNRKCICNEDYFPINTTWCAPYINQPCENNEPCAMENSYCIDNICQCKPNHAYHAFKCVPSQLQESCQTDSDCNQIPFAVCSFGGRCICKNGYRQFTKEICIPIIGGFCKDDEDCHAENAVCIENGCECKQKFMKISRDKCIPTEIGLPCFYHTDCVLIRNAECSTDNKCVCAANHVSLNSDVCKMAPRPLESICNIDADCEVVEHAKCSDLKCVCQDGYVQLNKTMCLPQNALTNHSCSSTFGCHIISHSQCSKVDKCICEFNFIALNNSKCAPLLNGYCLIDTDCAAANSVCTKNRCQCRRNYIFQSNEKCVPTLLGEPCQTRSDCQSINNAKCSNKKICVCNEDHYALSNSTCAPMIGSYCRFNTDCFLDVMECINNKCQCEKNYVSVSDTQCVRISSVYRCENNIDCGEPWHSQCSEDKICTCRPNNFAENRSTCLPIIGGNCLADHQCKTLNTVCEDFKCQCREGFNAVSNNLCMPSE